MVFGNVEHTLSLISDRVDQDIAFKREIAARVASDAYVQESMKDLAGSEEGYSQIKIINRLKSVINTYTSANSNIVGSLLIDSGAVTQVRTGEFDLPPEVSPEAVSYTHLVCKPALETGSGRGIRFWEPKRDEREIYDFLLDKTQKDFVVQKVIRQHKELNKIHDSSVNTIRICSLLMEDRCV